MFNILSKYDSYKSIFEKFRSTQEFKLAVFECKSKFPAYQLGANDTSKATLEMFSCFENWIFDLDENISDLEYTAFLDSYENSFKTSIREFFLKNINSDLKPDEIQLYSPTITTSNISTPL